MVEVREIDPAKLREKRGDVPKAVIARRTGGVYTRAAISDIERGRFKPSSKRLGALLDAYGATLEEVSIVVQCPGVNEQRPAAVAPTKRKVIAEKRQSRKHATT
jgi:transcriptional regulator with XRE-family HTH domain